MDETAATPGGDGTQAPPPEGGSSVPFEDTSLPFMTRLLETVKMAFADPVKLFSGMASEDIGPPVVYGLIIGTVSMVFSLAWNMLFGGLASIAERASIEEFALSTGMMGLVMIFSPLFVVVALFVTAAIYHVMLMIVGDAQRGFGVTLRAVCYGSTPQLLGVVPFCGSLVGGIWGMVLAIMGAIYGHRTDGWRAILAYFLPMIVCCCLVFFLASMLGLIGTFGG